MGGDPVIDVARVGKQLDVYQDFPRFNVQFIDKRGKVEGFAYERTIAAAEIFNSLEDAFIALGRDGGNRTGTPARRAWENARAALQLAKGPL